MARRSQRPGDLADYAAKRDFTRTPEPAGATPGPAPGTGGLFVVQRHRARRLHYDLRLEVDGVLASWAVPKGPTLDPAKRALAVQVEDHPMEYADFEGVIPAGEYGGGDVIVWDRGTWTPVRTDDPAAAIAGGELHFDLDGQKLAGRFVLIRRDRDQGGRSQWLLLHKNDDAAQPGWDPEDHPASVKSGRTNDEVAAAPEALWRSDLPASEAEVPLGRGRADDGAAPEPVPPAWQAPTPERMAALEALGGGGRWQVHGHRLSLTNLDKVLFPGRGGEPPLTKRDLVRYHALVAPTMLRYLAGRPVNMHRYPDGVDRPGFWHKAAPGHAPAWLPRWRYPAADEGETELYVVPDGTAALAWLANYGAVELHPWTSLAAAPDEPTWVLFDIDPGEATSFEDVLVLARLHRAALDHLGVAGLPTVSGQRGVQVRVPVRPGYSFAETRRWAETVSRSIGATVPELVSWKWGRDERGGLARLDYTQNALNKTLVVPYGVRPRSGAPVCVPIAWDELDDTDLRPDRWTVRTVLDRLDDVGDPLAPLAGLEQDLPALG
ncbi:MAG TPA: DNA polymerase ligase N-terminal domain-containing protein [Acidimicrobiales bacterium]